MRPPMDTDMTLNVSKGMRFAVATSFFYEPGSSFYSASCGLVKWCFSADQLANSPGFRGQSQVAVFTNDASRAGAECASAPSARMIVYPSDLIAVAARWATASGKGWSNVAGSRSKDTSRLRALSKPVSRCILEGIDRTRHLRVHPPALLTPRLRSSVRLACSKQVKQTVLKWYAVSRTEYDAVLLTDLDVDLFLEWGGWAPAPLTRVWASSLSRFLRGGEEFAAAPDHASPINAGVMLIKPSLPTWRIGLRALESLKWNATHGFELRGTLRERLRATTEQLCRRRPQRPTLESLGWSFACEDYNSSQAVAHDTWTFICGDADQGLFTHVYLAELAGRTFRPLPQVISHRFRASMSAAVRRELPPGEALLDERSSPRASAEAVRAASCPANMSYFKKCCTYSGRHCGGGFFGLHFCEGPRRKAMALWPRREALPQVLPLPRRCTVSSAEHCVSRKRDGMLDNVAQETGFAASHRLEEADTRMWLCAPGGHLP